MLDRIDIHVEVTPVPFSELSKERLSEKREVVRARVVKARQIQAARFDGVENVYCNSQMSAKQLRTICKLSNECNSLLKVAVERIGLSARAYDRILKVARTIADLGGCAEIQSEHIAEAIQYRNLDRESWAG